MIYVAKWKPELIIEGISLPIPSDYSQTISDLCASNSKRNLQGKAVKVVVAVKSTIPLKFKEIEWSKAAMLVKAIDGKNVIHGKIMDVREPYKLVDVEIYSNDRTCKPSRFDTDGKVYWDIEFKEIEL